MSTLIMNIHFCTLKLIQFLPYGRLKDRKNNYKHISHYKLNNISITLNNRYIGFYDISMG